MAERLVLTSVRTRVTALAALAVLVVLVVAGALLVVRQRADLVEQLDEAVDLEAERLAAAVGTGIGPALGDDDDRIVQVVDTEGRVVATAGDDDMAGALPAEGSVDVDGQRYRVASADLADGGLVVVAGSTDDVDESVAHLVRSLAWIVPAATIALAVVVWFVVGRTLRPVERIRTEVAEIGLDQLDRRVPQPAGGDEVARLAATMNEMLARLERSSLRQRQFVADASHELRTPLTRMRTELDVAAGSIEPAVRSSLSDDIAALQQTIDDLLVLARRDAGQRGRRELVDLDDLVLDEARAVTDPPVDRSAVSAAQVSGDPAALRRLVRNLLDNARRHAAGRVRVALGERDGAAVLVVADDGPGIPAARRDDVFERFTRLDPSRPAATPASGWPS